MAIDIFPRYVSELPGPGATLNVEHPMFPTFGWIPSMNFGARQVQELRRRVPTATFNPSANAAHKTIWNAGKARGRAGNMMEFPAAASQTNASLFTWMRLVNANQSIVDEMFPVNGNMSIAFGYHVIGAPASGFNILGSNTGTGNFNIRGDGSLNQVAFNWTLGDPETTANVTFGDDNWVFLQSQDRGVEIWQNGVLVGSQGSFGPRNDDTSDAYLGLDGVIFVQSNGQRSQTPYFYCYNRPLTPSQVIHLHKNPFPFVTVV